jgi:hypothetical protein
MSYRFVDSFRSAAAAAGSGWNCSSILILLSETYRVSYQNEFQKLVHPVGFIIRKFVAMHGHVNVKLCM